MGLVVFAQQTKVRFVPEYVKLIFACAYCLSNDAIRSLFPLDRGGGLAGDIVNHAVDARNLVDNTI